MVYRCEVCGKEISLPYNKLGDFNSHPFYVIGMFDNKAICYSCLTEKYTYCNQCKSYHLTSDMVQIYNGEYVCKNCLTLYKKCVECSKYYPIKDMEITSDDSYVCKSCVESEKFQYCPTCNKPFVPYDSQFCPKCLLTNNSFSNKDNPITSYHGHNNNKNILNYINKKDRVNPLYGIELEVSYPNGYCNSQNIQAVSKKLLDITENDFIYFERDSSISNGVEIITQPATLSYHVKQKDFYKRMFEILREEHIVANQHGNCGLHIHVNKNYVSKEDIGKIILLSNIYWDNFVTMSRRRKNEIEKYAQKINATQIGTALSRFNSAPKHSILNNTHNKTYEFRLFHSTIQWNAFIAAIQFYDSLINIAQHIEIKDIYNVKWEDIINTPELQKYWEDVQIYRKIVNNDRYLICDFPFEDVGIVDIAPQVAVPLIQHVVTPSVLETITTSASSIPITYSNDIPLCTTDILTF